MMDLRIGNGKNKKKGGVLTGDAAVAGLLLCFGAAANASRTPGAARMPPAARILLPPHAGRRAPPGATGAAAPRDLAGRRSRLPMEPPSVPHAAASRRCRAAAHASPCAVACSVYYGRRWAEWH